jgi:lipopolysaccharide/colanic/teichoic acid biosynthesis glycosyltransferase
MRQAQLCVKRTLDIVLSLCGLLVLSPLFAIVAVLVKLDSPGPVFFLQDRLGRNGKPFRIVKFRTMVKNAENLGEGLRVSTADDPRITRVGRILRQTSLDELPQLINVLKGDMSLVGPRPPATYHPYNGYAAYPEWAKKRFEMRPGITGLAQVMARNSVSWDERIRLDVDYVEGFSLWKDVKMLWDTVRIVVLRESIYP